VGKELIVKAFVRLHAFLSQYTICFMALFITHRCLKCFESVTLILPQHKGGAFKGPARGQCLNCMDEQEYDLTVPANKKDLFNVKGALNKKEGD